MNIYLFKNPESDSAYSYGYMDMVIIANSVEEARVIAYYIDEYGITHRHGSNVWINNVQPLVIGTSGMEPGFITGRYKPYNYALDE